MKKIESTNFGKSEVPVSVFKTLVFFCISAAVFIISIVLASLLTPMSYYKNRLTSITTPETEIPISEQSPPRYSEDSGDLDITDPQENDTSTSSLTSADTKESLTEKLLIEESANMERRDVTNNNLQLSREQLYGSMYSLSIGGPFASSLSINKDEDHVVIDNKHHGGAIEADNKATKTTSMSKNTSCCASEETETGYCHQHLSLTPDREFMWLVSQLIIAGGCTALGSKPIKVKIMCETVCGQCWRAPQHQIQKNGPSLIMKALKARASANTRALRVFARLQSLLVSTVKLELSFTSITATI